MSIPALYHYSLAGTLVWVWQWPPLAGESVEELVCLFHILRSMPVGLA